jgi:FtsZ-binding cell division protein ZapB
MRDLNEQYMKKIQDLQAKIDELEEENHNLSNDHLALMKK